MSLKEQRISTTPCVSRLVVFFLIVVAAATITSCIPQRNIVLMQDKDKDGKNVFAALENITDKYMLQPNDYLYINVSSPDPKLSIFFNPQQSVGTSMSNTQDRQFFYYMIDDSMTVDFPVVGRIDLDKCNLRQAKEKIYNAISDYLSDFTLIVRLASNSFTVLGEVKSENVYTMNRDQITIYEAIAMAGGFTSYAKRKEVKLLRQSPTGELATHVIDMTDNMIINSDLYYIYPNDVLYVRPMKIKMLGFGETLSLNLVTSLVTLYLLILSL